MKSKNHSILVFGMAAIVASACVSCHGADPQTDLSEAEPSVSNGIFTFSQVADGSVRVRPTDASSSFTRADTIEAMMELKSSPVTASTTPVEIGTVDYTEFEYQLNGSKNCRWTKGMFLPSCTTAATQAQSQHASESGLKQVAVAVDGMTCAAHSQYSTPIWQKKFRVSLAGNAAELDEVNEVRYTVWQGYGKTFVGSSRQDNFDASTSFLTPSTSSTIDPAKAIMKDGKEQDIAAARLTWSDNDPAKPAGQPCEL